MQTVSNQVKIWLCRYNGQWANLVCLLFTGFYMCILFIYFYFFFFNINLDWGLLIIEFECYWHCLAIDMCANISTMMWRYFCCFILQWTNCQFGNYHKRMTSFLIPLQIIVQPSNFRWTKREAPHFGMAWRISFYFVIFFFGSITCRWSVSSRLSLRNSGQPFFKKQKIYFPLDGEIFL